MDGEKLIATIGALSIVAIFVGVVIYSEFIVEEDRILVTELGSMTDTVLDQKVTYPQHAEIFVKYVELLPHAETGWHTHEQPLIGTVLHGEITVYYCLDEEIKAENMCVLYKSKTFVEGDVLIEAIDVLHNGVNEGVIPVKLHVVSMEEVMYPAVNSDNKKAPENIELEK